MTTFTRFLVVACVALCSSCDRQKQRTEFEDFTLSAVQAERDFCSTNISVAEKGLLAHRQWLLASASAGRIYNEELFETDNRLFQLYEFRADTNQAETFYLEGAEAHNRYLLTQHRPEKTISKEEVRTLLAHQQRAEAVGWKTAGAAGQ
jgi:hypothetical protein